MPNLYGATPESDREDFARLWSDPDMYWTSEIYPLAPWWRIRNSYDLWRQGQFVPYDEQTLIDLLADCKAQAPVYCRLSRSRDIPSDYVVEGNRLSNLREAVQARLAASGRSCRCIRCRERLATTWVEVDTLQFRVNLIDTGAGEEHFIAAETPAGQLAGFLRRCCLVARSSGPRS